MAEKEGTGPGETLNFWQKRSRTAFFSHHNDEENAGKTCADRRQKRFRPQSKFFSTADEIFFNRTFHTV
jgi:hypothetical protein